MSTSLKTFVLFEPAGRDRISLGVLGMFRARNKNRIHEIVYREFEKSGITQVDLANRMGRRADVVCRMLGAPGNWTLDTVSDLLFCISGGELEYSVSHPLQGAALNRPEPEWFDTGASETPRTVDSSHVLGTGSSTIVTSEMQLSI